MDQGAHLLPAFCPQSAAPGERTIFDMLKRDPGARGWIVLHSLDLSDHVKKTRGEADFVVLIPDEGLVVLEVKSHPMIKQDKQGWWLGNATAPDLRGPFKQASEALHSIRSYLSQHNAGRSLPMVSAVAFTSVRFDQKSIEWESWQVLDKQRLHSRPISKNLLDIIRRAREHFSRKGLVWMKTAVHASPEQIKAVASLLRPRFEVLESPEARRRSLQENLLACTQQQFSFLDLAAANERMLVNGLAGTGKTTLAVELLRRAKQSSPTLSAGFFCFNKLLGKNLEATCNGLPPPIRSGSFHSWMLNFSGMSPIAARDSTRDFWNDVLPMAVLEKLTAPGADAAILDLLVLDEAQDLFRGVFLDIFDVLLKGGLKNGKWAFFGDFARQDIFAKGALPVDVFLNSRAQGRAAQFTLSVNCRNTQEISTALTILARLKPGYSSVLRHDSRRPPEFQFYRTGDELRSLVDDALGRYTAEGFRNSDIVFLSPTKQSVAARMAAAGPLKARLSEYKADGKELRFCTVQAFKGLEAPVIFLTNIEELQGPADLDMFYVGMSRALHRLVVFCHENARHTLQGALL